MPRGPGDQRFGLVDESITGQRTFNRHAGLDDHEEEEDTDEGEDLSELTKDELQTRLKAQDLPTSGNKTELIDRLLNADAGV